MALRACSVPAQRVGLRALAVASLLARPRSAATLPPCKNKNDSRRKNKNITTTHLKGSLCLLDRG
ncbi:MAG: hypothetical protein AAB223_02740 [Pseudomonadota bacterium]